MSKPLDEDHIWVEENKKYIDSKWGETNFLGIRKAGFSSEVPQPIQGKYFLLEKSKSSTTFSFYAFFKDSWGDSCREGIKGADIIGYSGEISEDEEYMLAIDIEDFELKMLEEYQNNLLLEAYDICNKYL
jgi:hypothetical protein